MATGGDAFPNATSSHDNDIAREQILFHSSLGQRICEERVDHRSDGSGEQLLFLAHAYAQLSVRIDLPPRVVEKLRCENLREPLFFLPHSHHLIPCDFV